MGIKSVSYVVALTGLLFHHPEWSFTIMYVRRHITVKCVECVVKNNCFPNLQSTVEQWYRNGYRRCMYIDCVGNEHHSIGRPPIQISRDERVPVLFYATANVAPLSHFIYYIGIPTTSRTSECGYKIGNP